MTSQPNPHARTTSIAQFGDLSVNKYETPTGARLQLSLDGGQSVYIDALELEALTRARFTPSALMAIRPSEHAQDPEPDEEESYGLELLQNEFTMVGIGTAQQDGQDGLLIQEMNGGQAILLSPDELRSLIHVRHADFAPLVDTSGLEAHEEPDIDQF